MLIGSFLIFGDYLKSFAFALLIISSHIGFSQKAPAKFGKITPADFRNTICPIDSNAHAYFIFDNGNSYFQYAENVIRSDDGGYKGFQLHFNRHFRIKILDTEGFSWADFQIPLYRADNGTEEQITQLRAVTYNLEDGKIVKTKLERGSIMHEETSDNWISEKVALLNVKEGSIIEVEYSIISDFYYNLREWQFQYYIPVLLSNYQVKIPEYYIYNQTQKGYYQINREHTSQPEEISITYHQKAEGMSVKEYKYTSKIHYINHVYSFDAKNIPAFPIEDYLRTPDNYLSKIIFEIQRVEFPNQPIKYYNTTWETIVEKLLTSFEFGRELNGGIHLNKSVEYLQGTGVEGLELVNLAFNHLKSEISWNSINGKYVEESLGKAYRERKGNVAEVNLNLILLLRKLGFESHPVVLSTQSHGIINPAHPSNSSLNYVIATVIIDGKYYLLDATDPFSEINLLPTRCLNDKGLVVRGNGDEWINLMGYKPYQMTEIFNCTVEEGLSLKGENSVRLLEYAAYEERGVLKDYNTIEEYTEAVEKNNKEYDILTYEVQGIDSLKKQVNIKTTFEQKNYADKMGDLITFSPAFQPVYDENPFKLEKREYPVEFDYPFIIKQSYSITIPAGYNIEEIPEPLILQSSDKSQRYVYSINQMGDKIILNVILNQKKLIFLAEEYSTLKDFYQAIINKQNEMVVLKKSN